MQKPKIHKINWEQIGKQVFINIDENMAEALQKEWEELEEQFLDLRKLDVGMLPPTDYCHKISMNSLREDEATKQTNDFFSKKKYFIG